MTELTITHKLDASHLEEEEKNASGQPARTPATPASDEKPHSFAKQMLPYSGYVNHVSFLNTVFRPFVMLASPAVLWATLLFTTCISWLVGISVTLSQIFSAPPYNFSVTSVGLTNLSSFVASVLGTALAGPLIDGVVRRMSLRNGGTFGKYSHYSAISHLTISTRTRISPPNHDNIPPIHRDRLLRLGPSSLRSRPLGSTRDRRARTDQLRHPTRHHRRSLLRRRLPS